MPPARSSLSFQYEMDDGRSPVPIPALYVDRFRITALTPSEVLGLAGVTWTQSGARPWHISAASLGARDAGTPGSLRITDAAAGESSFLTAQISGPVVLTWLGRTTGPAGDIITALVDGRQAGSILIPPVYPAAATYAVEIPVSYTHLTLPTICSV